jgi:hypothetical protein
MNRYIENLENCSNSAFNVPYHLNTCKFNTETTTMEKKPVDPETFPILLLGNKFDLVSNVMWFSMKKIIQAGTSWGINITMSNVIVKSWARLKPCIFCMKVTTLSTDLMEISTSLTNEGRLNLLLFLIGQ